VRFGHTKSVYKKPNKGKERYSLHGEPKAMSALKLIQISLDNLQPGSQIYIPLQIMISNEQTDMFYTDLNLLIRIRLSSGNQDF